MTNYHCPTRFTPEQMKILSANPFTYKVSAIYIHYTLEFKNLFLAHYEAGEPVKDIFAAFGYDPAILGDNRMYAFARRISKQAKEGKVPTEDSSSVKIQKPAKVDYNTLPAQQSVSAMQREKNYRAGQRQKAEDLIMDRPSAKYEIIHSIVSQKDNLQNVKELCNIAGVSRSGYYNWLASEDKRLEREAKDKHDFELILNAYSFTGN